MDYRDLFSLVYNFLDLSRGKYKIINRKDGKDGKEEENTFSKFDLSKLNNLRYKE
jgi:hypothetical protein